MHSFATPCHLVLASRRSPDVWFHIKALASFFCQQMSRNRARKQNRHCYSSDVAHYLSILPRCWPGRNQRIRLKQKLKRSKSGTKPPTQTKGKVVCTCLHSKRWIQVVWPYLSWLKHVWLRNMYHSVPWKLPNTKERNGFDFFLTHARYTSNNSYKHKQSLGPVTCKHCLVAAIWVFICTTFFQNFVV